MPLGALTPRVRVFQSRDKDKREGEDVYIAIKYLF